MADSAFAPPLRDTLNWYWNVSIPNARRIGSITTRPQDSLTYRWSGLKWEVLGSGSGGGGTVDSSIYATRARLSNELNLKQDIITATNGINKIGNAIKLGGSITENTEIDGDETYGFGFHKITDFKIGLPSKASATVLLGDADGNAVWGKVPYAALSTAVADSFLSKKNVDDSTTASPANYVTQYQRKKTSDSLAALIGAGAGWSLTGNSGTTAGNFIGTTDDVDLVFKRNGLLSGRIGSENTYFGNGSGSSRTSGVSNAFFGQGAGYFNTTGSSNTFIGDQSGASNTTGSNNIYIGNQSGAFSTTLSNRIIINSITHGTVATDTVESLIYGIQSATVADQKLRVNGKFQINDATQGAGKVFTSDANGVGSWQTPSGGSSTDTTSLSSRINYKPRVYNVKAYGAVGDSVNDDRTAIQAAINAAADNGGGDVYFPNGKYWLGTGKYTSLASGANPDAQLYLPLGDYARSDTNLSIRFIGESAPNFYANPFDAGHLPITSGVVLASGLTGTGSIIGTDYKFQAWGNFNFNHLILENLTLRANTVGDSTVATAVDGRYMSYLSVKGVRADNKRDQGSTIKPSTTSYAIRMPGINNFVFCNVDNFLAYNYGVGIEAGEHSNMDNVFIDGCYIGVKATESNHSMNINRMCIARTAINFVLDTSLSTNRIGEITAQQVSVENTTTGGYWFTHVADLIDNSSGRNWVGNIHYNKVGSFGGPNNTTYTIPKTTKVNLIKPSNQYVSTANAVTGITIENTNSGTSAQSNFQAIAGTTGINFGVSGTGFTPNNIIAADQAYINSSKNLNILMSAGNMKVATVNTNQYETVEFNNPSQYPSLVLNATRAAGTSQNAIQFRKIGVSKFMIGNDLSANNTNDFYIYDYGGAATRLYISSGGSVGIGNTSPTSTLNVTGSVGLSYVAKTSAYTATAADHTIDCTTGTFTVTLPTAVSVTGRMYVVKNSGAGAITVGTTSSQTIDGSTTYSLGTQYKYVHLQSNGANWIVIANN